MRAGALSQDKLEQLRDMGKLDEFRQLVANWQQDNGRNAGDTELNAIYTSLLPRAKSAKTAKASKSAKAAAEDPDDDEVPLDLDVEAETARVRGAMAQAAAAALAPPPVIRSNPATRVREIDPRFKELHKRFLRGEIGMDEEEYKQLRRERAAEHRRAIQEAKELDCDLPNVIDSRQNDKKKKPEELIARQQHAARVRASIPGAADARALAPAFKYLKAKNLDVLREAANAATGKGYVAVDVEAGEQIVGKGATARLTRKRAETMDRYNVGLRHEGVKASKQASKATETPRSLNGMWRLFRFMLAKIDPNMTPAQRAAQQAEMRTKYADFLTLEFRGINFDEVVDVLAQRWQAQKEAVEQEVYTKSKPGDQQEVIVRKFMVPNMRGQQGHEAVFPDFMLNVKAQDVYGFACMDTLTGILYIGRHLATMAQQISVKRAEHIEEMIRMWSGAGAVLLKRAVGKLLHNSIIDKSHASRVNATSRRMRELEGDAGLFNPGDAEMPEFTTGRGRSKEGVAAIELANPEHKNTSWYTITDREEWNSLYMATINRDNPSHTFVALLTGPAEVELTEEERLQLHFGAKAKAKAKAPRVTKGLAKAKAALQQAQRDFEKTQRGDQGDEEEEEEEEEQVVGKARPPKRSDFDFGSDESESD